VQLAAAKNAHLKRSNSYCCDADPYTNEIWHEFYVPEVSDERLTDLPDLPFPFVLNLGNGGYTEAGLRELKKLKNLAGLTGIGVVTDAGMKEIKQFRSLTRLQLAATDAGLQGIRKLVNLNYLELYSENLSDAGLAEIGELKNLVYLSLKNAKVTDANLKRLKN